MAPNVSISNHNLVRRQQGSRPQGNYRTAHSLKLNESRYKSPKQRESTSNNSLMQNGGATTLASATGATAALTDRLQELLVLEFHKDGSRQYMHLTVRGLYRHVLHSITDRGTLSMRTALNVNALAKSWKAKAAVESSILKASSSSRTNNNASSNEANETEEEAKQREQDCNEEDDLLQGGGVAADASSSSMFVLDEPESEPAVGMLPLPPPSPGIAKAVMDRHSSMDAMPLRYSKNANANSTINLPKSKSVRLLNQLPPPPPPMLQVPQPQQPQQVTYRERLGAYLHPRDMRRLVTPFSTSNEPDLIVRRHVMLLNFDPLRAIILRDRLLVLVPDGADSLLVQLEERVRGGSTEIENSIFGDKLSASLHGGSGRNENMECVEEAATADMNHSVDHFADLLPSDDHGPDLEGGGGAATAAPPTQHILNQSRNGGLQPRQLSELTDTDLKSTNNGVATSTTASVVDDDDTPPPPAVSNHVSKHNAPFHARTSSINDSSNDDEHAHAFGDEEFEEMKDSHWADLSFELQCADAVLHVVGSILSQDTFELQTEAEKRIHLVLHGHGFNDDPLLMIRTVKDAVQVMTSRVNGFIKSMNRILDDDEDMALMNLSRLVSHPERFIQPVPQRVLDEESDEPELILEANLHNSLTLLNYLDLIKGQINTAKELIDQKQDATRNRLLFANMMISIFSLCATVAAMIGSFFGMNVPNGYEEGGCLADGGAGGGVCRPSTYVFRLIVGVTLVGCGTMCLIILGVLWFSGTIPRTSHTRVKDVKL